MLDSADSANFARLAYSAGQETKQNGRLAAPFLV
jgi:hypothetical protein